ERVMLCRKNTGQPVRFEIANQTRQVVDDHIRAADKSRRIPVHRAVTSQAETYRPVNARLVGNGLRSIGLAPCAFGAHSLRRIKTRLIYRRADDLRAICLSVVKDNPAGCQLLWRPILISNTWPRCNAGATTFSIFHQAFP